MSSVAASLTSKIIIGMSGGVDSSVTAAKLKADGYHNLVGLFMKNWEEPDPITGVCPAEADFKDVVKVCDRIGIPYYSTEFIEDYWNRVFERFLKDYQNGLTPNPDILCNREIKFDAFLKECQQLGGAYLATGHYAQTIRDPISGDTLLKKAVDLNKDQTYFLYTLTSKILSQVLFPIGTIPKPEVRALAEKYDLATKNKKDSTGICFIGERKFKSFLSQYLKPKKGNFIDYTTHAIVGTHSGAQFYTIGQRRGLGLGGEGESWFVVDKNMERNEVSVVRGAQHPALFGSTLRANELSFVSLPYLQAVRNKLARPDGSVPLKAKIRYRQNDQDCLVTFYEKNPEELA
jgi:tRNA-specific 2-thiouridylase